MGLYIDPKGYDKEEWAKDFGKEVRDDLLERTAKVIYSQPTDDQIDSLVCLMNNGSFSVLGVAYDETEFKRFTSPEDKRSKKWFIVPTYVVKALCPNSDNFIKG